MREARLGIGRSGPVLRYVAALLTLAACAQPPVGGRAERAPKQTLADGERRAFPAVPPQPRATERRRPRPASTSRPAAASAPLPAPPREPERDPEREKAAARSRALSPHLAPPPGYYWIDSKGGRLLAGTLRDDEEGFNDCEVWNARTKRRLVEVPMAISAGGSDPVCVELSPAGTMVRLVGSRGEAYRSVDDPSLTLHGVFRVAPDDKSAISAGSVRFYSLEEDDIDWCNPRDPEHCRKLATIRDPYENNWEVTYCSAKLAVVDTPTETIVVAAHTGDVMKRLPRAAGRGIHVTKADTIGRYEYDRPDCAALGERRPGKHRAR